MRPFQALVALEACRVEQVVHPSQALVALEACREGQVERRQQVVQVALAALVVVLVA